MRVVYACALSRAQVSAAFGLPYAGTAMREAAGKWPVLAGMGKCDGEMCQVGRTHGIAAVSCLQVAVQIA